ncbi:NAD(P)-dependent dehydrogenase (short-subunit alcohol dehydrogenase family) [Ureibacillus xyleni]|uniref:NAD(P)-dependent dehydrogenase (Short-subunit alcohol dehydrogenase family) n=1 Tax=Ureibacillus xyleni TaxID=614648 RepID=A0A285SS97_9BACL|nr:SDR family oxidoreductase [Ureibacillus xyleni]SOC09153.1 NAD(P)-dependent dehydrogenase (short-subunit alcohol dehydrogenase family) [Ureibacillus xyleni]
MFNLQDKVAIVTGGSSGIGLATVKAFVEKGAKVILSDINTEAGNQHVASIRETGGEVTFFEANVAEESAVQALVKFAVDTYGKVDIIVNNAGIGVLASTHELTYEEYHRVIKVNQDSIFYGSKYAIQEFLKTGSGGAIVNVASILGTVGEAGAFAYNASKGAANLMTKSLAAEYSSKNIRINSVCPGYVESGMVNREALGDFYEGLVARHPIGRLGQPEEIAHAIVFLCENEFVTGCNLLVDGGYTAI